MFDEIRRDGRNNDSRHTDRTIAYTLCQKYNKICPLNERKRRKMLEKIFKHIGENVTVKEPFHCDYGYNISIGNNVDINYNCVMLDDTTITIGNDVRIAPNVNIFTVYHPLDALDRKNTIILSRPIVIKDNAWLGGNCVIMPGVTIGKNAVIGAGAVVTKDIPDNAVAVGVPARVIKILPEK